MIVDPRTAAVFIETYKAFLLDIYLPEGRESETVRVLEKLAQARERFLAEPTLLEEYIAKVKRPKGSAERKVLEALKGLQFTTWVYLKDTRAYSVLLKVDGSFSCGVLGLTEPLRDIVGGSGAVVEAGVVCLNGRFVCDGLISEIVWLGRNYKKSYTELYTGLRQAGRFQTRCETQPADQHGPFQGGRGENEE